MWTWTTKPVIGSIFWNWDLCIIFRIGIWNMSMKKNRNTKKIAFKVVQIKSLAMHITNQKLTKYLHGTWCLLNILMNVGIKEKMIILTTQWLWLLTQYSHATYDCLWSRVTYKEEKKIINSKITKIYKLIWNLFDFGYISDESIVINQIIELLQLSQIFHILFTDRLQTHTQMKHIKTGKCVIKWT